jgi:hypothetical protein
MNIGIKIPRPKSKNEIGTRDYYRGISTSYAIILLHSKERSLGEN